MFCGFCHFLLLGATSSCAAFLALTISTSSCHTNRKQCLQSSQGLYNFRRTFKPNRLSVWPHLVPLHTVFLAPPRDSVGDLLPALGCAHWVGLQSLFQKFLFFWGPGRCVAVARSWEPRTILNRLKYNDASIIPHHDNSMEAWCGQNTAFKVCIKGPCSRGANC